MDFKQGNPLPFFMTYPGYLGMGQERKALKDFEYLQQTYPAKVKEYQRRVAEILDKLDKWMCTVKRTLYPGLMKTTILDTLSHVIEDVQAMKSISPEQINVSGGVNEKAT